MAARQPNDAPLELYRRMALIRRFEQTCLDLYKRGTMQGVLHVSIGQEAVSVGACYDLRTEDCITSTHRGHNDIIAKGARVDRMMAELLMKDTGYCRAKGGSMHIIDFSLGILGANGIVAAGVPIAVGAGLGFKLRGEDRVCVCFFGDGAVNQGQFHEGVNMAAIWKLPVVFVCHNNAWAESTSQALTHAVEDVADRAKAYGIPGVTVDAIDVAAVREACRTAVDRARRGEGPSLINCRTYRWYGHHIGDVDQPYRTREELAAVRAQDCVAFQRRRILDEGIATEAELDTVDAALDREIAAAVEDARAAAPPPAEAALEHVYAGFDVER